MSIRKTIGGDRLGSGKKMKVDLKSYNRSTHNRNKAWRSTMAAGTLVPFYSQPILPGSTYDIELNSSVFTAPTVGPLFGSYKMQMDLFLVPMRLYIARLHNNESGLGMDMENVHIPQLELNAWAKGRDEEIQDIDNSQVNPSSILAHLGIRGAGLTNTPLGNPVKRQFNAIPYLAYYEIYKNYYANQQEEIGAIIHTDSVFNINSSATIVLTHDNQNPITITKAEGSVQYILTIEKETNPPQAPTEISLTIDNSYSPDEIGLVLRLRTGQEELVPISEIFTLGQPQQDPQIPEEYTYTSNWLQPKYDKAQVIAYKFLISGNITPKVRTFPLKNIDLMKREILQHEYESPLIIDNTSLEPYNLPLGYKNPKPDQPSKAYNILSSQEGLLLKTYQNDMYNNWMNSDWIDGENGINQITAVQIINDKLEIPSLILAKKVFNVLNRIALSGGTYDDWLEVTYDHERIKRYESPAYMGGLIKEIEFEEIVSNSASEIEGTEQPLGTLAGRGVLGKKHKGGKVVIKTDEPAYIIGIVSITPRIDYSQGNQWDTTLKTIDDLHKPELDGIGFQDLITDEMAWWDTAVDEMSNDVHFRSAGKQPAWINYQTDTNVVRGNFAVQAGKGENGQMWMTLNRMYEYGLDHGNQRHGILDLTSYIDPVKFNHIFAQTSRDAQNFWVQIGMQVTARQKMSARVMPNL